MLSVDAPTDAQTGRLPDNVELTERPCVSYPLLVIRAATLQDYDMTLQEVTSCESERLASNESPNYES